MHDYEKARVSYEKALAMREQLFSLNDPGAADIATTLHHLGSTHLRLSNFDKALEYYSRSKSIRMDLFGTDSLEVAEVNNSIASYYKITHQYELAEPLFRELLLVLQGLPESNPKPLWEARTLDSLGDTLTSLNRYEEAIDTYRAALELKQILLGNDAGTVAETQLSLAGVLFRFGQFDDALIHAEEAVRIRTILGDQRMLQIAQNDLSIIRAKVDELSATAEN